MNVAIETAAPEKMHFWGRWPIRWKLIAIILVVTLFGLTVVFAGMTVSNRIMFERRLANDMAVLAEIVSDNSQAALSFDDPAVAKTILAALRANRQIVRAILYDAQGQRFASYERDSVREFPLPVTSQDKNGKFLGGRFAVVRDVVLEQRKLGHLYLESDLTAWTKSLRNYVYVFLLLGLLSVGLTFVLAVFLQRIVTKPIAHLAETAREISRGGDYRIRAKKLTEDELGVLVDGFNGMLGEIQRRDAKVLEAQSHLEQRVAERTAQLQALNKELETFSYSVSHDLRAPLRSIHGFSQAILEDYSDRLDGVGKGYLDRVCAAAQRMGQLIDDLLQLSRVTRTEPSLEEMDLSAAVASIAQELREREPQRIAEFVMAPGVHVQADPRLLRVALENLLENAWKFTSRKPTTRIEFGVDPSKGEPVYYLRDNGAGFDMAFADKLFSPFQRLHSPAEFPGTGIGLANVQRVIQKHGGRLWAEAAPDQGATFYFTLARKESAAATRYA